VLWGFLVVLLALDGENRNGAFFLGSRFTPNFAFAGALSYDSRVITKVKDFSERTYSGGPGGQGFLRDEDEPKRFTNLDAYGIFEFDYDAGTIRLRPSVFDEDTDLDKRRDQYRRVSGQFQDRTVSESNEQTNTLSLTAEHEHTFPNAIELESRAVVSRGRFRSESQETSFNSTLTNTGGSIEESKIDDVFLQVGSDATAPVSAWGVDHEIGFGFAARRVWRDSDREVFSVSSAGVITQTPGNITTSQESDYSVTETYLAGYVMDTIRFGSVTVAPGLRLEHVRDDLEGGLGSDSPTFTDLLPSIAATWEIDEQWRVQAGIARTVNRPKLEEIAPGVTRRGPRSFFGNPDLEPARAWGYDLGLTYGTSPLFLGVNLFHRDVTDVIESSETATNVYEFRNVGDGWVQGIELEQRIDIGRLGGIDFLAPLSLVTNQTFLRSRVDDPLTGSRRFAEQPDFVINASLQWDDPDTGTRAALVANYTDDRPLTSYEGSGQIREKTRDAELIIDLRVEQEVMPGFSLFASAENLTDEDRDEIEFVSGVLSRTASIETGRTFFVGAKLSF